MENLDFNPRAPRGARLERVETSYNPINISIHAPREGRDRRNFPLSAAVTDFNPRAPRGARPVQAAARLLPVNISIHAPREGRDRTGYAAETRVSISIHAPREGRDRQRRWRRSVPFYFNPRAPRGARPSAGAS